MNSVLKVMRSTNIHHPAISVEANLRKQVKSQRDGRSQNRLADDARPAHMNTQRTKDRGQRTETLLRLSRALDIACRVVAHNNLSSVFCHLSSDWARHG